MQDHQLVAVAAQLRRAALEVGRISDRLIDEGLEETSLKLLDALIHLEDARVELIERALQGPPRRSGPQQRGQQRMTDL